MRRTNSKQTKVCFMSEKNAVIFQQAILDWYEMNHRGYSWRGQTDPYKILVSEIMLQQTNADRVSPVYQRFIQRYPSIRELAQAGLPDLMTIIKPIGLSYRAHRLKRVAERLIAEYDGDFPAREEALLALPGIGQYIANAILCFAFDKKVAMVDVNVVRLYHRVFGITSEKARPRDDCKLWEFAQEMLPVNKYKEYNLALIDLSAQICTPQKPKCEECPTSNTCYFYGRGF
jgi:A/G-specific adenine glycosylase